MNEKWLDMLAGYAANHQHPVNIRAHLVGVPNIMLGMFIPMSLLSFSVGDITINGAMIAVLGLTLFYLSLDVVFALVFAVYSSLVAWAATVLGEQAWWVSVPVASTCFFGGYALQFWGHAVEGRPPVLLKHPIEANMSAPLFVLVELFKILGLRDAMFNDMKRRIAEMPSS